MKKEIKESNLLGVIFVLVLSIICIGILYLFFW